MEHFFYVIFLVFLVETFKKVVFIKGITLMKVGNRSCRNKERTDHHSRKATQKIQNRGRHKT